MKLVYCSNCDAVSTLASLERERCQTCGRPAARIVLRRPWKHWAAVGVIAIGAAVLLVNYLPEVEFRLLVLLFFVVLSLFFSSWGLRVLKDRALELGRSRAKEETE